MTDESVPMSEFAEDGVLLDQRSHAARFPITNTGSPRWHYITAVFVDSWPWPSTIAPTDEELRMVASFHEEYCTHWYRGGGWFQRMQAKYPFDVDGGAAGRLLGKYDHGGWCYRIRTWQHGPRPYHRDEPMTLVQVLDRVHHWGDGEINPRWTQWKADHPDIFGAVTA